MSHMHILPAILIPFWQVVTSDMGAKPNSADEMCTGTEKCEHCKYVTYKQLLKSWQHAHTVYCDQPVKTSERLLQLFTRVNTPMDGAQCDGADSAAENDDWNDFEFLEYASSIAVSPAAAAPEQPARDERLSTHKKVPYCAVHLIQVLSSDLAGIRCAATKRCQRNAYARL